MPERVSVDHAVGIIEVASEGVVTVAENAAALKEVIEHVGATGYRRVLADTRKQTVVPSIFGILEFGQNLPRNILLAMIVEPGQPTAEIVDLLRVIAGSHGTRMGLFAGRDEALAWLLREPLPEGGS